MTCELWIWIWDEPRLTSFCSTRHAFYATHVLLNILVYWWLRDPSFAFQAWPWLWRETSAERRLPVTWEIHDQPNSTYILVANASMLARSPATTTIINTVADDGDGSAIVCVCVWYSAEKLETCPNPKGTLHWRLHFEWQFLYCASLYC